MTRTTNIEKFNLKVFLAGETIFDKDFINVEYQDGYYENILNRVEVVLATIRNENKIFTKQEWDNMSYRLQKI